MHSVTADEIRSACVQVNNRKNDGYKKLKDEHIPVSIPVSAFNSGVVVPVPTDWSPIGFAHLYEDLDDFFYGYGITICPLPLVNPSLRKWGLIQMGSGLREFDEQGLHGYRLLQYHWKRNVTNGTVRRLVEGSPGSAKGSL